MSPTFRSVTNLLRPLVSHSLLGFLQILICSYLPRCFHQSFHCRIVLLVGLGIVRNRLNRNCHRQLVNQIYRIGYRHIPHPLLLHFLHQNHYHYNLLQLTQSP